MNFTIKNVLDDVEGLKIIAGLGGLENNISIITFFDSPDFYRFTSGCELFLSSGFIFKDDPSLLDKLIKKMKENGAAGLAIKIGRYINHIPKETINLANKLSFPIISVDKDMRYTDVNPILNGVIKDQANEIYTYKRINKIFNEMARRRPKVCDVINELNKLLEIGCAFYVTSKTIPFNCLDKSYISANEGVFKNEVENMSLNELLSKYYHIPIKIDNKIYGYLILEKHAKSNLNNTYEVIIGHSITIITLFVQRELTNYQIERKYKDEFVRDLLYGEFESIEEVNERALLYNWNFNKEIVVAVLDINKECIYYTGEGLKQLEQKRLEIILKAVEIFEQTLPNTVYTSFRDRIVFIIQIDSNRDYSYEIKYILDEVRSFIKKRKDFTFKIGVGKNKDSVLEAHQSYTEAEKAIKIAYKESHENDVIFFNNYGLYNLLNSISNKEYVENYLNDYLYKLIEYDKQNNGDLLDTIYALHRNNWNVNQTAKELIVHYNTLTYRKKKIEDILNINLEDADNRLNLAISLKIYNLT